MSRYYTETVTTYDVVRMNLTIRAGEVEVERWKFKTQEAADLFLAEIEELDREMGR